MKKAYTFLILALVFITTSLGAKTETEALPMNIDNSIIVDRITNEDLTISIPNTVFSFRDADIKIKFNNPQHNKLLLNKNRIGFIVNGENKVLDFVNGEAGFKQSFRESKTLTIYVEDFSYSKSITVFPLWAIAAPLIIIVLYLVLRMIKKQ